MHPWLILHHLRHAHLRIDRAGVTLPPYPTNLPSSPGTAMFHNRCGAMCAEMVTSAQYCLLIHSIQRWMWIGQASVVVLLNNLRGWPLLSSLGFASQSLASHNIAANPRCGSPVGSSGCALNATCVEATDSNGRLRVTLPTPQIYRWRYRITT